MRGRFTNVHPSPTQFKKGGLAYSGSTTMFMSCAGTNVAYCAFVTFGKFWQSHFSEADWQTPLPRLTVRHRCLMSAYDRPSIAPMPAKNMIFANGMKITMSTPVRARAAVRSASDGHYARRGVDHMQLTCVYASEADPLQDGKPSVRHWREYGEAW